MKEYLVQLVPKVVRVSAWVTVQAENEEDACKFAYVQVNEGAVKFEVKHVDTSSVYVDNCLLRGS